MLRMVYTGNYIFKPVDFKIFWIGGSRVGWGGGGAGGGGVCRGTSPDLDLEE